MVSYDFSNVSELDVLSKRDGTYIVTKDNIPVHITEEYGTELYRLLDAAIKTGDLIPRDYDLDAKPAVIEINVVDAAKRFIEECRDLKDLGSPLPVTDERFLEMVKWNQAYRKWELSGQPVAEPSTPRWFNKLAVTYFAS